MCRTAEREAGPVIKTCSSSSKILLAKLHTLTKNKNAASKAITKANSLVGSSGRAIKHTRGARAVPTDCNGVLTLYERINTFLGQSLTASITTYSDDLRAYAGADGSCSSLKSSFDKITISLQHFEKAFISISNLSLNNRSLRQFLYVTTETISFQRVMIWTRSSGIPS